MSPYESLWAENIFFVAPDEEKDIFIIKLWLVTWQADGLYQKKL